MHIIVYACVCHSVCDLELGPEGLLQRISDHTEPMDGDARRGACVVQCTNCNQCTCTHSSCGLKLSLEDFQRISDRVPFISDLKPSGKYVMEDVHKVGGTPAVLKYLNAKGFINADCLTVTGVRVCGGWVEMLEW